MADRGLLIRAFITAACGLICAGCLASRLPRVAGRVIDAETGRGVEGAGVYLVYDVENVLAFFGEPGGTAFDGGWELTDSDGRFEFSARWTTEGGFFGVIDTTPMVQWVHPDYTGGIADPEIAGHRDIESLEFRASRDEEQLRYLKSLPLDSGFCEGALGEARANCIALMSSG